MSGWIGVDLDGTVAHYDGWRGHAHIGAPIAPMIERIKAWIAEGREVRLVTARAGLPPTELFEFLAAWKRWSLYHIGAELKVTDRKDFRMIEFWDDRAVRVEFNTGMPAKS